MKKKIAIIGAGLSGLSLARQLTPYANVELFEKSRGVSGRMSTRRAEPFYFDHGAQFFTATTPEFKKFLKPLLSAGVVAPWNARFTEFDGNMVVNSRQWDDEFLHFVGVPAMNAMNKHLAIGLAVNVGIRIVELQKNMSAENIVKWSLLDENENTYGEYDWVISTAPAQQTTELMPQDYSHYRHVANKKMSACFSLMIGFGVPLNVDFDAALVKNSDISWISVNNSKPQRSDDFSLLVHSTNEWADQHIDNDKDDVMNYLCRQTEFVLGQSLITATHKSLHGWRYANISKQANHEVLIDDDNQLAACGDWCINGKVESAYISSHNLGNELIEIFNKKEVV